MDSNNINKATFITAGQSDIPEISLLAASLWPAVYADILSTGQIKYMMDMMYSEKVISAEMVRGIKWYLIKYGQNNIGYTSLIFIQDCCKLDKLYISRSFRGRGIGRKTMEFIKAEASAAGAKKLILNVNKYNIAAQKAYQKFGFRHVRDEVNDIGNNYVMDDFVLQLDI